MRAAVLGAGVMGRNIAKVLGARRSPGCALFAYRAHPARRRRGTRTRGARPDHLHDVDRRGNGRLGAGHRIGARVAAAQGAGAARGRVGRAPAGGDRDEYLVAAARTAGRGASAARAVPGAALVQPGPPDPAGRGRANRADRGRRGGLGDGAPGRAGQAAARAVAPDRGIPGQSAPVRADPGGAPARERRRGHARADRRGDDRLPGPALGRARTDAQHRPGRRADRGGGGARAVPWAVERRCASAAVDRAGRCGPSRSVHRGRVLQLPRPRRRGADPRTGCCQACSAPSPRRRAEPARAATSITASRLSFSTARLCRLIGVATPNAPSAWPSSSSTGAATAQAPS